MSLLTQTLRTRKCKHHPVKNKQPGEKMHFQTTRMKLCSLCSHSYVWVTSRCREMLFLYWSKIRTHKSEKLRNPHHQAKQSEKNCISSVAGGRQQIVTIKTNTQLLKAVVKHCLM